MPPNGCGPEGSIIKPPDFRFKQACDDHDDAYEKGGTATDKAAADLSLLKAMKARSAAAPWYKAAYLYPAAYLYYGTVRVGGWYRWGKK